MVLLLFITFIIFTIIIRIDNIAIININIIIIIILVGDDNVTFLS